MKIPLITFLMCAAALSAAANEIVRGTTLADGQQLYASDLHGLIDSASIGVQFYSDKQAVTGVGSGFEFLALDPGSQVYRLVTAQSLLYGNTNFWAYQAASGGFGPEAQFNFYDQSNQVIRKVDGVTLAGSVADIQATNNLLAPWLFTPWIYNVTNYGSATWPYTNVFPVTNLFVAGVTVPTLTDTDTVPVFAQGQSNNTAVTLASLGQYFSNKNYLPAYTSARVIFNGNPTSVTITNNGNPTYGSLSAPINFAPGVPVPVTFTAGTTFYYPQILTNALCYAVSFATNAAWFRVYTNYWNAAAGTNWLPVVNSGAGTSKLCWCTNYTSFGCDAIPSIAANAINSGYYEIVFRQPSQTPWYYVTALPQGTSAGSGGNPASIPVLMLTDQFPPTTNRFRLASSGNTSPNLIQVVVSPQ
jgi:hypothetical protein